MFCSYIPGIVATVWKTCSQFILNFHCHCSWQHGGNWGYVENYSKQSCCVWVGWRGELRGLSADFEKRQFSTVHLKTVIHFSDSNRLFRPLPWTVKRLQLVNYNILLEKKKSFLTRLMPWYSVSVQFTLIISFLLGIDIPNVPTFVRISNPAFVLLVSTVT